MTFEVKVLNEHGHRVTIYKRHSFMEAVFDVFALAGRAVSIDCYREDGVDRERVMTVSIN